MLRQTIQRLRERRQYLILDSCIAEKLGRHMDRERRVGDKREATAAGAVKMMQPVDRSIEPKSLQRQSQREGTTEEGRSQRHMSGAELRDSTTITSKRPATCQCVSRVCIHSNDGPRRMSEQSLCPLCH